MNSPDIQQRLDELADGTIQASDLILLQEELRQSAEARRRYCEELALDQLLAEIYQEPQPALDAASLPGVVPFVRRCNPKRAGLLVAAAAAVALGFFFVSTWRSDPRSTSVGLKASADCSYRIAGQAGGTVVGIGQTLEVDRGVASLDLNPHTTARIEGPARMKVLDREGRIELAEGKGFFEVSKGGKGFEVHCPGGVIRDIGTKFGVTVTADGTSEAQVTEGLIEITDSGGTVHRVESGLTGKWGKSGVFTILNQKTPGQNPSESWKFAPIGAVKSALGAPAGSSGRYKIEGGDGVLWGKADRIPYFYALPEGEFDLIVKLGDFSPSGVEGIGGVQVRLLEADGVPRPEDSQTFLGRRFKDRMLQLLSRPLRGGDSLHRDLGAREGELWLRAMRAGDVLSFWSSPDGQTWSAPRHSALRAEGRVAVGLTAFGNKGTAASQFFESVRLGKPQFGNSSGWLGNSLPGGGHSVGHVINYGRAIWTDPVSGDLFLNGEDENSSFSAWKSDGTFRWFRENPNFQHGSAVAADDQWVYQGLHGGRGQKDGFVRVNRATGRLAGGPYLSGKLLFGMDRFKEELILSDSTDGSIRFWNAAEMKETRSVPFERPGPLAVDRSSGELWVIRMAPDGRGKSVIKLTPQGSPTGVEITSLEWPRGLAVGKDGKVYIADSGPSQQIHLFDSKGLETGRIGAEGGLWSTHAGTVRGQTHPDKLSFPSAVTVDDAGNLTVLNSGPKQTWGVLATGSGTDLRKFDPAREPVWNLLSTEYVNCGDFLPGSDGTVVYSRDSVYALDASKPPALGWKQTAFTVDPFRYPEDPRLTTARVGGNWMRTIKGKPFLIVTDMVSETISFFRFTEGSKILVPSARFNRGADNRPLDSSLWRDANGDGAMQAEEKTPVSYQRDMWGLWVDSAGHIWTAAKGGPITRIPVQDLDSHGNPIYDISQARTWPRPEAFFGTGAGVSLERVYYLPENDTMFLGGYTSRLPKSKDAREWGTMGTEFACFDHWSTKPKLRWRIDLPYAPNLGGHNSSVIKSAAFAGDYVFLIRSTDARVFVHRKDDGKLVTTLQPGPEVGGHCGLIDIMHGMNATKRANGEYVIIIEDDDNAKNILLRWKP